MTDKLKVLAHFEAIPGKEGKLKQILIELKNASLAEVGCAFFELLQNETIPTSFTFIEEWDSKEHFDAHLNVDHLKEAKAKMVGILDGIQDVRVYKVVD